MLTTFSLAGRVRSMFERTHDMIEAFSSCGMPPGSFVFALAWMRLGKEVHRKSAPNIHFKLAEDGFVTHRLNTAEWFTERFLYNGDIVATDWQVVGAGEEK